MKNRFYPIAALLIFAFAAEAQETVVVYPERIHVGLKIGANYSNVYDAQGQSFIANPKLGFAAGAFLSIPIVPFIGIQPEVLFSQKGFQATGDILGATYNLTRTTNYIDVPLFITLKPVHMLTIMAGPQYSYLTKQTDVFATATTSIVQEQEFENDNLRKNTLCFAGGADINLQELVLSGRMGWDLLNNNGNGTSTTPRYKNAWYQFTIGIRF